MKIGIDFDGICTDLSSIKGKEINEHEYLYSPVSIQLSKPRIGILEIVSVLGLFADLSIVTSRPDGDLIYIKEWLLKNQLLSFFEDILCCGDQSKSNMIAQHRISLLIDDKIEHTTSLSKDFIGILWNKQPWIDLIKEILALLIKLKTVVLKSQTNLILKNFDDLSDLGSSPVLILSFDNLTKLKLRVCFNEDVKSRIVSFLKITEYNNYNHACRLVALNGLAILKTYRYGVDISSFDNEKRLNYILKTGIALAKLHALKADEFVSDFKLHQDDEIKSLLVFSADNYNMIVTQEDEIVFIDLEACNIGSRWIDVCWAKNLLCKNEQERNVLEKGYSLVYEGAKPEQEKQKLIELDYKLWLTYQLQNSKVAHLKDKRRMNLINGTIASLWN
jgi:hypothetical protein